MPDESLPLLSVVLPAYEEADNLRWILPALHETLNGLGLSHEIIVIDAYERRDDTEEVCAAHGARHQYGEGSSSFGGAVRQGIRTSRGEYVVLMDADGSHNPAFIAKLWAAREGADLVIASRYIPGGRTDNPAILIWMSLFVNVVFRWVLGLKIADVSNSFRLYRGESLRALKLECSHFDIVEEIVVKLPIENPGYRIKEIPFFFEQRRKGATKRDLVAFAISYVETLGKLWRLKHDAIKARRRD